MYNTQGIVIRQIKYGETSVICKIFTFDFGIQSYIIKGVRNSKSKNKKANILFPGAVLDLVTYGQQQASMGYLKEFNLAAESIGYDNSVVVNCIQMFAVEVLDNFLIDHQEHQDIYIFYLKWLTYLQHLPDQALANAPIYYLINVGRMAGYSMPSHQLSSQYYGLQQVQHPYNPTDFHQVNDTEVQALQQIMEATTFEQAMAVQIDNATRRHILHTYLQFIEQQMPGFKPLKCLSVLHVVLS